MDRVQPLESHFHAAPFLRDKTELTIPMPIPTGITNKCKAIKDEIIFTPIRPVDCESPEVVLHDDEVLLSHSVPRVIVTMENDPLDHFPLPNFDNLWSVSTFLMNYTDKRSCKIVTPCGRVLFKGIYPRTACGESCKAEALDKKVKVLDPANSDVLMLIKYTTPPYQICYEEVTTIVEILEPDGNLIATITQKKTWMNARISRDVTIHPGSFGKANIYVADFSGNDSSVNFKTNRSGLIVATLCKNFSDKNSSTAYTLQVLREIKPRDKAILVGFMMAKVAEDSNK